MLTPELLAPHQQGVGDKQCDVVLSVPSVTPALHVLLSSVSI